MQQRAVVTNTKGKLAEIEVRRATMCDGCEKNGGCSHSCELSGIVAGSQTMRTTALNKVGANIGDIVEVETESTKVLGYAALVFLLPILVCAVFYYLTYTIVSAEAPAIIAAVVSFVLTFLGISIFDRKKKKKDPDIVIVNIVTPSTNR